MQPNPVNQDVQYTRSLWARLQQVNSVRFESSSPLPGYDGVGIGHVSAQLSNESTLIFTESGTWHSMDGVESEFKNIFCWVMHPNGMLSLDHLRYGLNNPVHLQDLQPVSATEWHPTESFLCNQDRYTVRITLKETDIRVYWRITGPKKDEYLAYIYQSSMV